MHKENTENIFKKILEIPLRNQNFEIKNVYNLMYLYSDIIFNTECLYVKRRMYENSQSYHMVFIQVMSYFLEERPDNYKLIHKYSKQWVKDHQDLLSKPYNAFNLYCSLLRFLTENNIAFDQNIEVQFDVFTS